MRIYLALGVAIVALAVAAVSTVYSLSTSALEIDLARQAELDMLRCRRHEKDFLLRYDQTYVDRFECAVDKLFRAVVASDLVTDGESEAPELIVAYREAFRSLVDRITGIGLDQHQGLRGKMRAAVHQLESVFEQLRLLEDRDGEDTLRSSITAGAILAALISVATWLLFHAMRTEAALRERGTG